MVRRKKKKPSGQKKNKKQVPTVHLNFDALSRQILLDKTTGLELEAPGNENESHSQTVYSVTISRPGEDHGYNVSNPDNILQNSQKLEFDPSQIRVTYKEFPIDMILRRIERDELNLNPDFQRTEGIWDDNAQSRLIESLLIRIPIPVFYIDGSEDDKWIVVDGLQRLNTFKRFALEKKLVLKNLEFLTELHGKRFDQLQKSLQRRILESTIGIYLIDKGTPQKVKLSIFRRINTGGLPLSSQEIRHALFQGSATVLLNKLAESSAFQEVIDGGIGKERMADRECILRCLAFMLIRPEDYFERDMEGFLNNAMAKLQDLNRDGLLKLENRFVRSMQVCSKLFGKNAFRKTVSNQKGRNPINRSLFEVWGVALDKRSDMELRVLEKKAKFLKDGFQNLLSNNKDFVESISVGTGEVKKVKTRFATIDQLIEGVLHD